MLDLANLTRNGRYYFMIFLLWIMPIFTLILLGSGFAVYYSHYPRYDYLYDQWWSSWRIGAACLWAVSGFLLLASIILCASSASRNRRAERERAENYEMNVASQTH